MVDDNPDLAALIKALLQRKGHEVSQAFSGQEALAALGLEPDGDCGADLALLDLNLPGLSGLQVFDRMRGHPQAGKIPVIFISGSSDAPDLPQGPAIRSLRKPFGPERMIQLIEELLS